MRYALPLLLLAAAPSAAFAAPHRGVAGSKHDLSTAGPGPIRAMSERNPCAFCHLPHRGRDDEPAGSRADPLAVREQHDAGARGEAERRDPRLPLLPRRDHRGRRDAGAADPARTSPTDPGGRGRRTSAPISARAHPVSFAPAAAGGETRPPPPGRRGEARPQRRAPVHRLPRSAPGVRRGSRPRDVPREASGELRALPHVSRGRPGRARGREPRERHGARRTDARGSPWRRVGRLRGVPRLPSSARRRAERADARQAPGRRRRALPALPLRDRGPSERRRGLDASRSATRGASAASTTRRKGRPARGDRCPRRRRARRATRPASTATIRTRRGTTRPPARRRIGGALAGASGVDLSGQRVEPARFEYEVCLKCHGDSVNKPQPLGGRRGDSVRRASGDPNLRLQLSPSARSFHPVAVPGRSAEVPGLKPPYTTQSVIACGDCHASDGGPGAGGAGARGPHGSIYPFLLERATRRATAAWRARARMRSATSATIATSSSRIAPASRRTAQHVVEQGSPCSACHTAHGVSSERVLPDEGAHLVDFDLSIVQARGGLRRVPGCRAGRRQLHPHLPRHRARREGVLKRNA